MNRVSNAAFYFSLGFLIIAANVTVSIALRYMKTAKKTTVIFLASLAASNLVQGIVFLFRGVFFIWDVNTAGGCMLMQAIVYASVGSYMIGILFVYLDLYLSLKKMSISRPVISSRTALIMTAACWLLWLGWGAVGYTMRNRHYTYISEDGCSVFNGISSKEFILISSIFFFFSFASTLTLHVLIYRLIRKARIVPTSGQAEQQRNANTITRSVTSQPGSQASKWLRKNDAVLKVILVVLVQFVISWFPPLIVILLIHYCESCASYIRKEVVFAMYLMIVIQYNSNGIIYLMKIKEFKNACRRICCRFVASGASVRPLDTDNSSTRDQFSL